ncbi:LCP family protein [Microbacterium sp. A82]|uniref:LCP family protein n=1 Tax=Microbacterium sp. A82 TaxID=3450452 RepID=UPI003F3E3A8E
MGRQPQRSTIAQHGQQHTPSAGGQLLKMVGVALATVLVAAVGITGWVVGDLGATYTADAVDLGGDPPPGFSELTTGANILVAGTDNCEPEYADLFGDRCANPEDGVRSDVLMLVNISDEPRRVTVVSFPRDLLVDIPSCDTDGGESAPQYRQMINSAFSIGGLACSARTIEDLTGVDVQYAASINWGGVIEVTNAVGGVDICVATAMKDADSGIDLQPGTHNLVGQDALAFLRARYSTEDGSDLNRIGNQQLYMSSLVRKITSEQVLTNPGLLLKLARTTLSAIDPSTTLTNPVTLVEMGLALKDIPVSDYAFVRYPVADAPDDPNRLIPIRDAADQLFEALERNEPLLLADAAGQAPEAPVEPEAPVDVEVPVEGEAPSPAPGETAVALPPSITGTTGETEGCVSGRVVR